MLVTTRTVICILILLLGSAPSAWAQEPPPEGAAEASEAQETASAEGSSPDDPVAEDREAADGTVASEDSVEGVWKRLSVVMTKTGQEMEGIGESYFILTKGHYVSIDDRGAQFGTYEVQGDQLIRHRQKNTLSPDPATEPVVRTIRFDEGQLVVLSDHPEAGPLEVRLERVE